MILDKALVFGEVVFLSAALLLSTIAAFGFYGSPFGKVMTPIPITIAAYLIADGSALLFHPVPAYLYTAFTSVALIAAAYAAVNAMLLLTGRRTV